MRTSEGLIIHVSEVRRIRESRVRLTRSQHVEMNAENSGFPMLEANASKRGFSMADQELQAPKHHSALAPSRINAQRNHGKRGLNHPVVRRAVLAEELVSKPFDCSLVKDEFLLGGHTNRHLIMKAL